MELPLFPLHTVLCPGIALPLHIFEARYRDLVGDCIDTASPFGVVLIRDGQEVGGRSISFSSIGTLAEIRRAGRYPDGRYDLLVVGSGRFAVEAVTVGARPYLVAQATLLDDEVGDTLAAQRLANLAARRFVDYLELLQARDGETTAEIDVRVEVETEASGTADSRSAIESAPSDDDRPGPRKVVIPDDPTTLSYLLTGIIQVELPRRQALLESETTEARLRDLLVLIARETFLLRHRLRAFSPERQVPAARRS
jgi:Lon protease-like protein